MPVISKLSVLTVLFLSGLLHAGAAQAQMRGPEIRLGLLQHDVLHPDTEESGLDIELLVLAAPLRRLPVLGSPRPYVSLAGNSDGETSFASVGLAFDRRLTARLTGEIQFGYAVHDGNLNGEAPETQAARLQLGSRDLFRTALGIDYRLDEDWSIGVQWDHLSHGQIIGDGHNQGIDAAGLRLSRQF